MPGVLPVTYSNRLYKIQSFAETVWGTSGAATSRWMGIAHSASFKPFIKSTVYSEDRGSLQPGFVSNVLQLGGEFTINWEYLSYEDINYMLMSALKAVSPTGVNPYTYTYPASTTATNPLQPFTLEYGYDIMTRFYAGCIGTKFGIEGEYSKQWKGSLGGFYKTFTPPAPVSILSSTNASPIEITTATAHGYSTGYQVVVASHLTNTAANGTWTIIVTGASTFTLTGSTGNGVGGATGTVTRIETPAISDRTIESIITPGTLLYIESAGGTPGTTPYTNILLSFKLDVENNVKPIWVADSLNPQAYAYDMIKNELTLKLLNNATTNTLIDTTLKAGTGVVVRLVQSSGSKSVTIDFAGVLGDDPDRDGNHEGAAVREIKLTGRYDSGSLANSLKIVSVNAVASLP